MDLEFLSSHNLKSDVNLASCFLVFDDEVVIVTAVIDSFLGLEVTIL